MKTEAIQRGSGSWKRVRAGALLAMVALAVTATADDRGRHHGKHSNSSEVTILSPDQKHYGKTYGDLAAAWWQWALGIPEAQNPLLDETGEFANINQHGPVWFLAGTFGNSVERDVCVPAGKAVFLPVHNWIFGAAVFDCEPSVPGVECDVPTLRAAAAEAATGAEVVEAWIDGEPVANIRDYRAISPKPFKVKFPEGAVLGLPAGTFAPHVADGYWLMLAPLPEGAHELRLRAVNSAFELDYEIVIHLTVGHRRECNEAIILSPHQRHYGHSYGEWGALWWRWALGIPADQSPLVDETGEFAGIGQSGPVWFLAGNFGGTTERSIEVPFGKALFFPVINQFWLTTCVGEPRTIEGIRPLVKPFVDAAENLEVEIDGASLKNLNKYRADSKLFCAPLDLLGVTSPEDLAAGCPDGASNPNCMDLPKPRQHFGPADGFGPAMTDGYWILLAPLPPGPHTINFSGMSGDFSLDVSYNVTVLSP